uniref:Secreted protein n=1 Tax=Onchocerca volvulus TaxID=6282 RepID=A0A8R1XW13_ONCVO
MRKRDCRTKPIALTFNFFFLALRCTVQTRSRLRHLINVERRKMSNEMGRKSQVTMMTNDNNDYNDDSDN